MIRIRPLLTECTVLRPSSATGRFWLAAMLAALILCRTALADDQPSGRIEVKHSVTGLFSADRQEDLREVLKKLPDVELVSIDYEHAEAVFAYDPEKLFKDVKPEDRIGGFNELLRSVSSATFGIKPLCTIPRNELQLVEIGVIGLDCKGCSLVAYEAVQRIEGVEQARASFREGLVIAWIDPKRTDRAALEEALKNQGIPLKTE